jgi:NAD(P)-binding Rossmann-like domain
VLMRTDYLVVGAGASALAFVDALVAEADVEVTVLDRRQAPGGHWQDAYPFVRLHSPSAYYGVNSLPLGRDRIETDGRNAGFYERAAGAQVCEYFARVAARLTQTGRVRLLTGHEQLSATGTGEQVRDLATGQLHEIEVRRKLVDARYLEASIPATHRVPFDVAPSARVVPVGHLPAAIGSAASYVVLGAGKTAVDACVWLLDNGVAPDRIRWIRPRDAWFQDRRHFQPLEQVTAIMEGISLDAEAGAQAASVEELFERLEASGRLVRIDPSHPAEMYRGHDAERRRARPLYVRSRTSSGSAG